MSGGPIAVKDMGSHDLAAQLLNTRDSWPELWEKQGISWPASARTAFLLERSGIEAWMQAVKRDSYYRVFHFRKSYWGLLATQFYKHGRLPGGKHAYKGD